MADIKTLIHKLTENTSKLQAATQQRALDMAKTMQAALETAKTPASGKVSPGQKR